MFTSENACNFNYAENNKDLKFKFRLILYIRNYSAIFSEK